MTTKKTVGRKAKVGAPKGNKNAVGNRGGKGQEPLYKPEYARIAEKFSLLGATDAELADALGVTEKTIGVWKKEHIKFGLAQKKGKVQADANVGQRLYERAMGYSHAEDKIFNANGSPLVVPTTKHYPPDSTAAIFWLKNRRPVRWRDRQMHEHMGEGGGPVKFRVNGA
jgi:hypothetical protein